MTPKKDRIIQRLIRWAEEHDSVRAMLLTSTRTIPNASLDLFSDYDVILAVNDIRPYYEDRSWLEAFGSVLVLYRDPIQEYYGFEVFAYITQYEDGLKIDFTLYSLEILHRIAADPVLPDDLDIGYRVLLDKDGLTTDLKPPTFNAYIPNPPDESTYMTVIEEFFHETTYVAKLLWRDELMPAKYSLDTVIKLQHLRQMLEWQVEIDHDWTVKPGLFGKGLKKRLGPEIWAEVEGTFAGADLEENWEALFKSITLFRKIAVNVGKALGYKYPYSLDGRMLTYLHKAKSLEPQAKAFL